MLKCWNSGRESTERAESKSYYLEVDVKFNNVRNGRSRSIFLGFNFQAENANGGNKPLEIVALRFLNNNLCAQFLTLFDGQYAFKSIHLLNHLNNWNNWNIEYFHLHSRYSSSRN